MESATTAAPRPTSGNLTRLKQRRVTQACDFCHRRGVKCRGDTTSAAASNSNAPCLTCIEYGQTCTRNRQPKKRGIKARVTKRNHGTPDNCRSASGSETATSVADKPFEFISAPLVDGDSSSRLRSRKIITALLDVYLDTVHPAFPFFCEREIWVCWRDGSFPDGPGDYMGLMCMCALSAHHAGNGALFTDDVSSSESTLLAESYLKEAIRLVPVEFNDPSIDLIRSYGLLALLGAQSGNNSMAHKYLGLYHGICAQFGLYDESKWSPDISTCEREVRRRIWWAMYRLEVHTACVLGGLVRCPETQCNVGYPSGIHHPAFIPGRDGQYEDWFSGWNTTTDLYRVLEHAVSEFRAKRLPRRSILESGNNTLGPPMTTVTAELVMRRLSQIQQELMPQFVAVSSRSSDSGRNRCGFQASNMLCTIHLARMILSISEDASLQSVLQTAAYMMEKMNEIPREYIRAVGSTLLQQLAGVGHMLVGVARKHTLSLDDYGELRRILVSMIEFLAQFNKHYSTIATAAQQRLAAHVADLDERARTMLTETAIFQQDFLSHQTESHDPATTSPASVDHHHDTDEGILSANLMQAFLGQYFPDESS